MNTNQKDIAFYGKQINYLEDFITNTSNSSIVDNMNIKERLTNVKQQLNVVKADDYIESINGTIGLDPLCRK